MVVPGNKFFQQKIVDSNSRPNPFHGNKLGRKWWALFMKQHPIISLCSPEHLQLCHVQCCTPEAIADWFIGFDQFSCLNFVNRHTHTVIFILFFQ